MEKTFVISSVLVLMLLNVASACQASDSKFTLNIADLNVDLTVLENMCSHDTATMTDEYTIVRSQYDERVILVFYHVEKFGSPKMAVKLPFDASEEGAPVANSIEPDEYNWVASVKQDLAFLKETNVLDIEDSDINAISNIANYAKNIAFCKGGWVAMNSNCECTSGEEMCVLCADPPSTMNYPIPSKPLKKEELVEGVCSVDDLDSSCYYCPTCQQPLTEDHALFCEPESEEDCLDEETEPVVSPPQQQDQSYLIFVLVAGLIIVFALVYVFKKSK